MNFDALFSIAEVASVFIGFAALATVMVARQDSHRQTRIFLLITVVTIGSLVLMGALIPAVVPAYGIDGQNVWRISGGLVFVLNLVILLATHLTTRGFKCAHRQRKLTSVSAWSLEPAFQLLLVINVLGFRPVESAAIAVIRDPNWNRVEPERNK